MVVSNLKNQVIKRLDFVNDEQLLEEILNLIEFETETDVVFSIPAEHQIELDISLEQLEKGEIVSNKDVDAKIQKWLSK